MVRRDPWAELARLQEQLHELLDQVTGGPRGIGSGTDWRPALDLAETDEAFLVYVELPGVPREELELEAEERWLEISGRRPPEPSGDRGFLRLESHQGSFRRRLELPGPCEPGGIEARLRRGLLEITVPKGASARSTTVPVHDQESEDEQSDGGADR
ncbi:MAG: Hsp20/alpha crystallin family protein [Thermoanaerobaculia bacterium]|nr:Hsp20/alpha crystallin family protein [Thermoanaerobaculia bacterium]